MDEKSIKKVRRSPEEAREAYNRAAKWIDIFEQPFEKSYKDRGLKLLKPRPGETILELGCGTGYALEYIASKVGPEGHASGIDIAEEMLAASSKRITDAGLSERVDLLQCDAVDLPFEKNSFDGIFSSFVLELFKTERLPLVLGEIKRVLKPSGRICTVSLSRRKLNLAVHLYEWFHRLFPRRIDCRPIYLVEALENRGFNIIQDELHMMFGLPVAIVRAGIR